VKFLTAEDIIVQTLLDYLLLALVRTILFPLVILPDPLAFKLARFYVSLIFLFVRRLEGIAERNLELVFPDKSSRERAEIRNKSKDVLAGNILGFVRISDLNKEKAREACDYSRASATLEALRKSHPGTGVIIPTLHFDMFEIFIQLHALNYRPVSILARGFGFKNFDKWWNGKREIFGNTLFSRKGGYKEIIRRLKKGEDIVLLCDQNVKSSHAIFADFFGLKAATTKTVALAALRTGAPIVFGCPVQISPGKFEVVAEEILHPKDVKGDTEQKLLACTEDLHRKFENHILKRPEAWFWIHRRWKTRPPGELENIYSESSEGVKNAQNQGGRGFEERCGKARRA